MVKTECKNKNLQSSGMGNSSILDIIVSVLVKDIWGCFYLMISSDWTKF